MTNVKLKEGIASSIDQMVSMLQNHSASTLQKKPSNEQWSAMQIANHVIEAVKFWVTDLEALLVVPGAKWGRNHEHVRRLAAVEENYVATLTPEAVIAELQALVPLVATALEKVSDADLEKTAPSYNANFDGKPLSFLIDHLIIKHVAGHVEQMQRHLQLV